MLWRTDGEVVLDEMKGGMGGIVCKLDLKHEGSD